MTQLYRYTLLTLVITGLAMNATSADINSPAVRISRQSALLNQSGQWLEGYSRNLTGQTIEYHGTRDDCTRALITRASDGSMAIAWDTAPIPEDYQGDTVTFFWLAGVNYKGIPTESRRIAFDLSINGKKKVTFYGDDRSDWTVTGKGGETLSFSLMKKDRHGDGFGYMWLTLPMADCSPGQAVSLNACGHKQDSQAWFMVFKCIDGLAFFKQRAGREYWLRLRAKPSGTHTSLEIETPLTWAGDMLEFSNQEAVNLPPSLHLRQHGINARATTAVKSSPDSLSRSPLKILFQREQVINIPGWFWQGKTGDIRNDMLVFREGTIKANGEWLFESYSQYWPQLPQRLIELSEADLIRSEIHIITSSHQDIAWMDSPMQCVIDRDLKVISPALETLSVDPEYRFDMENILCLREYLERRPEKRDEIYRFSRSGRITWGASYTAPYEEMYSGEALVRQFYLGRLWLKREFPGCDSRTYWNVDVPGRVRQMPQILKKSGVNYAVISRHKKSIFKWKSPDGSEISVYSPGHYGESYPFLKGDFHKAVAHLAGEIKWWQSVPGDLDNLEIFPVLSDWDMSPPENYSTLVKKWQGLNTIETDRGIKPLQFPALYHSTAEQFLDRISDTQPNLPVISGERPNVWLYIHGPAHQRALAAGRQAWINLCEAETFSAIRFYLEDSLSSYPQKKINQAWEAAIYPDHGWGGKNGKTTDVLFRRKFESARDMALQIRGKSLTAIAANIRRSESAGIPIVVFNSLSWQRTGPVTVPINFPAGAFHDVQLSDCTGRALIHQLSDISRYTDGSLQRASIHYLAEDVPPIGYITCYLNKRANVGAVNTETLEVGANRIENDFYRITLGQGGLTEIFDKELQRELLATQQFLGAELFTMKSEGNGAGEFADVQPPTMDGFDRMHNHHPAWTLRENGPLYSRYELKQKLPRAQVVQSFIVYHPLKRIDFRLSLIDWNGEPYREYRLAFPVRSTEESRVTYESPFGTVEIGKDEIKGAAGERYTTPCAEVHPRGIGNWIGISDQHIGVTFSSSVAVWDHLDPSNTSAKSHLLQPILLASRRSCHSEGPLYSQAGDHHFSFSMTSHPPDWRNGYHSAMAANQPLLPIVAPACNGSAELPEVLSFFSVDRKNVIISTIKLAEDQNGLILRCFDSEGKDTPIALSTFFNIHSAFTTNLVEENPLPVQAKKRQLAFQLNPFSIQTIKLKIGINN